MTADELPSVLARLRALLARGMSLRQAADRLKKPRSTLGRLAKIRELARRPAMGGVARLAGLPSDKRTKLKRLLASGKGGRVAAREAGVGRKTAWKYQQLSKFGALIRRSKTPLPCKPWRCPVCRCLINLTICVVCGVHKPPSKPTRNNGGTGKTRRRAG